MAESVHTCPFCGKYFKQLGQHLYRCPERFGREYHHYLKTSKVVEVCDGCHKRFKRLDLHLKSSQSCHLTLSDKSNSISQPLQLQHSWSMDNAQLPLSSISDRYSDENTSSSLSPKLRLKLPPKIDMTSWKKADDFMKVVVTPSVLALTNVDEMNTTLNSLIYEYFSTHHGTVQSTSKESTRLHKPHLQTTLAKVRREKNHFKNKFRQASKSSSHTKAELLEISKSFHALVRQHNKIRRDLLKKNRMNAAKHAIRDCAKNFWSFSDRLLSENEQINIQPSFDHVTAHRFFSSTYSASTNKDFHQPSWMPAVSPPEIPFFHGSITYDELAPILKRCRSGSSPCPFDAIPYAILKQYPSLHPALLHLYNTCLLQSRVPSQWKMAVIKLIPKSKAQDCSSDPKNF